MKETFKNVANKVKTTGKKAISIAKKNPAVAATGFAIVTIGVCNMMKKARKQKENDPYAKGYNNGVDAGLLEAASTIANYLSGKTGTPSEEIMKELDQHITVVNHKIQKVKI